MIAFYKENRVQIVVFTIAVLFLYMFSAHGPLFWDDTDWVVNNPYVHALTWENIKVIFTQNILYGIHANSNYYRPFLLVTLLFNYLLTGTNPVLYHLINDLIHLGNGILIYYLLLRWFENKRIAFVAALIFLIHPLQTEAVAYIVGRGDPLSVFFVLCGILLYVRGRPWLAALAAVFAILTRETGVLFPVYLAIVLMAFELRGTLWTRFKKAFVSVLPYLGISAIYAVMRLTVLNFDNSLNFGSQQNIYTEHVLYRAFTFFATLPVYVRLLFFPSGLHFDRNILAVTTLWKDFSWLGLFFIVGGLVLLWLLYKNRRGNAFTVWFFGLGIFFSGLSLSSGIVASVNGDIFEHWLYFPMFGFATVFAWYFDRLWSYIEQHRPKFVWLLGAVFIVYCSYLGAQTIACNLLWANPQLMFQNILRYEPDSFRALNNLGNIYYNNREFAAAEDLWKRGLATNTRNPVTLANLASMSADGGDTAAAEHYLKMAIQMDPGYYDAYVFLEELYIRKGNTVAARQILSMLKSKFPTLSFSLYEGEIKDAEQTATTTAKHP